MAQFKKIEFLDYLRAVAILFIAFYHYVLETTLYHIRPSVLLSYPQNMKLLEVFRPEASFSWLGNLLVFLAAQGYQFVGVFIFISGFGLTYSKLTKGGKPWQWVKRISRLLPQFQIAIIFAFVVNYFSLHYLRKYLIAVPTGELYPYLRLLLYPFVWTDFYGLISSVNPSLWFSGLILQYYVVYDGLYWLLLKMKPWMFFLLMAAFTFWYRYEVLFHYEGNAYYFSLLPVRLVEFGFGMVAAYIYVIYKKDLFYSSKWWWSIVGLVIWYVGFRLGFTEMGRVVNDSLTTVGLMMMGIVVFRNLKSGWFAYALGLVGIQSYWIYLLHNQPITQLLTPWTFMQWDKSGMTGLTYFTGFVGIIVVSFVFSWVMNESKKVVLSWRR